MVCHTVLHPHHGPVADVALPAQAAIDDVVAWDEAKGVLIVRMPLAANDDAPPPAGRVIRMPDMRLRGLWGRLGVAPDDADALMRGLAEWAVAFAAAGAIIRWA